MNDTEQKAEQSTQQPEKKITAVDWAAKKPLQYTSDGKEVTETLNPKDIKTDILLIERGAHYSLIAQFNNCIILEVDGQETDKYREQINIERKEKGQPECEKTDENDARLIFSLYRKSPNLFIEKDERNIYENRLRYNIKMRYSFLQSTIKLSNESSALEKEYIKSDAYKEATDYFRTEIEKYDNEIIRLARHVHNNEVGVVLYTKLMAELNASIFVSLVDVRNFQTFSAFKKFCGYGKIVKRKDAKTDEDKKSYKFNRQIKNVLWTSCDSTVIKHRLEPYRTIYDSYKAKKLEELKSQGVKDKDGLKGHADALARRKVCQKMLKKLWTMLRRVSVDVTIIEKAMNMPKQEVTTGKKSENGNNKKNGTIRKLGENKNQVKLDF